MAFRPSWPKTVDCLFETGELSVSLWATVAQTHTPALRHPPRRKPLATLMRRPPALHQQRLLGVHLLLAVARFLSRVRAGRKHLSRLRGVRQVHGQYFLPNLANQLLIFEREQNLHPVVDIARHQVGAPSIDLFIAAIVKVINAAMFQESSHHANHFDVVADSRQARPQTADSPHNELDFYAGLRSLV